MDDKTWQLLMGKVERIEKQVDKLIEFRGWVLGAACVAGALGGILVRIF